MSWNEAEQHCRAEGYGLLQHALLKAAIAYPQFFLNALNQALDKNKILSRKTHVLFLRLPKIHQVGGKVI
jgi:hypothetical protein